MFYVFDESGTLISFSSRPVMAPAECTVIESDELYSVGCVKLVETEDGHVIEVIKTTSELLIEAANDIYLAKVNESCNVIAGLEEAIAIVDTESKRRVLEDWKAYRRALFLLEIVDPNEIIWPTKPPLFHHDLT